MKNDLISIIVPVFNSEQYLSKTIDSLLKQNYHNIEILLIDDGSTDNSLKICNKFALKDKRIVVIHSENKGVSNARNLGLIKANGEFIAFVDSDDYIEPNMIDTLYNLHLKTKSDITMCSISREDQNDIPFEKIIFPNKTYKKEEAIAELINDNIRDYLWNKLYKSKLFEDIKFPIGKIYEDVLTLYKLFLKANHVSSTDLILYHYIDRNNSIVNSNNGKKAKSLYYAYKKKLTDLELKYPEFTDICRYQRIVHEINYFMEKSLEEKQNFKNLKNNIIKLKTTILLNKNYIGKEKLKLFLMVYLTRFFIVLRKKKLSKKEY